MLTKASLWSGVNPTDPTSVRYLAAEFGAEDCTVANLPVLIKYDATSPANDFSSLTRITIVGVFRCHFAARRKLDSLRGTARVSSARAHASEPAAGPRRADRPVEQPGAFGDFA